MVFSRVNYWAELPSMELRRGEAPELHEKKINAVNAVKVTRLRKAVLLVVGTFISLTGC